MAQINSKVHDKILEAISEIAFGSIEIYIVDNTVTQITKRDIKKIQREGVKNV